MANVVTGVIQGGCGYFLWDWYDEDLNKLGTTTCVRDELNMSVYTHARCLEELLLFRRTLGGKTLQSLQDLCVTNCTQV